LSTLGIRPQLGRGFRPDDSLLGNERVLMISHRYWQNRFGSDANIIGRTVRVDGEMHEIVGVLPDTVNDWRHLGPFDVFRPLGLTEKEMTDRSATSVRLVGRRSRTLTREQDHGEGELADDQDVAEALMATISGGTAPSALEGLVQIEPEGEERGRHAEDDGREQTSGECPAEQSSPCAARSAPRAPDCCARYSWSPCCWRWRAASSPSTSPPGPTTGCGNT
ncbi:MAG: hypothetical protein DMF82_20700, partial [Acidobacteria bacterium]